MSKSHSFENTKNCTAIKLKWNNSKQWRCNIYLFPPIPVIWRSPHSERRWTTIRYFTAAQAKEFFRAFGALAKHTKWLWQMLWKSWHTNNSAVQDYWLLTSHKLSTLCDIRFWANGILKIVFICYKIFRCLKRRCESQYWKCQMALSTRSYADSALWHLPCGQFDHAHRHICYGKTIMSTSVRHLWWNILHTH